MSRTDKDVPTWVAAEWWEPYHTCGEYHSRAWQRFHRRCNLPAEPTGRREPWWIWSGNCDWVPIERRRVTDNPPRWYVDHIWSSRIRTRVRDQLRRARGEYRATGEVDVVADTDQHRHGASWLWS